MTAARVCHGARRCREYRWLSCVSRFSQDSREKCRLGNGAMKEDSVLRFKWQSFPSHMVFSLDTCYEKQQFVDLSLVCKDGTILKCHKMVLANSSSFFRRLLTANDHPHPMIILHDIEADDLKTLVNFMYCGEIQVVQSEVKRLLKLAKVLQITGLQHIPSTLLVGEDANCIVKEQYSDASKKTTTTMTQLKVEEARNLNSKSGNSGNNGNSGSEHEGGTRTHIRHESAKVTPSTQVRIHTTHSHKASTKVSSDMTRKKEEISISELCQRLETSNSGISIIDVNDMPSTSKGLSNVSSTSQKRKESLDNTVSWPHLLNMLSKDGSLPLKKLCIMDEVEITMRKPFAPVEDSKQNEPLDRRKLLRSPNDDHNMNMVFIKDEIDISSDMEEDVDMDPLEVDDIDNESADNSKTSSQQQFYSHMLYHSLKKNARSHTEYSVKKGSNS